MMKLQQKGGTTQIWRELSPTVVPSLLVRPDAHEFSLLQSCQGVPAGRAHTEPVAPYLLPRCPRCPAHTLPRPCKA